MRAADAGRATARTRARAARQRTRGGLSPRRRGAPPRTPTAGAERDVPLDLLRGLAIAILVVNHLHLESALEYGTATLISAAEALVAVSGVVVGMVFGRRWRTRGRRATARMLLARARKLYVATLAVVALVGALTLLPGSATEVLTRSPSMEPGADLYAYDGVARTALAIATLEAGPWQFSILGLFIALLVVTPALLWALERGWWAPLLGVSWAVYAAGRAWPVDALPSQSERAFPILAWQVLFVHGLALGWHRERVARWVGARRRAALAVLVAAGAIAAVVRIAIELLGPAVESAYFDKTLLDPLRLAVMTALATGAYLAFRGCPQTVRRPLERLLLPLGRNSFYVFIVHVFLCLAVAATPGLAGAGAGLAANTAIQLACLAALWLMVRRRFLFRWVPR